MSKIAYILIVIVVYYFAIIMVKMILPYFPYTYATEFLGTKSEEVLQNKFYIFSFYIHITTSFVALLTGIIQFFPRLIKNYPVTHKKIGFAYVYSIILFACPSGFILAIHANGGVAAKTGFVLQCIVWFTLTMLAVSKAIKKQWLQHIQYMLLSYIVTLAAFSLRFENYIIHQNFHFGINEAYVLVTWLSWVGNLLIGLLLIEIGFANFIYKKIFNT